MFKTKEMKDIVLLDFGNSKIFRDKEEKDTQVLGFSAGFCAPEVQADKVSLKSDIFSFGVVLYEFITGKKSCQKIGYTKAQEKINSKSLDFFKENPTTGSNELDNLISQCVEQDYKLRPTAIEIRLSLEVIWK